MSLAAAQKIRELRLTSKVDEALVMASQELGKGSSSPLLGEAIRILILKGQHANAATLYQTFTSDPASGNNIEPEALVRLALQMGRPELLEKMPVPSGPAWLVERLKTGVDPLGSFEPESLDVSVANGPALYTFVGPCPHCGAMQSQAVATSLLVLRDWFCPVCFGAARLTLDTVIEFLESHQQKFLQRNYFEMDAPLLEYVQSIFRNETDVDEIVLAMGQEYLFMLNELIVVHNISDNGTGES